MAQISGEELERRRKRWRENTRIAGPGHPIYRSGMRISPVPRLHEDHDPYDWMTGENPDERNRAQEDPEEKTSTTGPPDIPDGLRHRRYRSESAPRGRQEGTGAGPGNQDGRHMKRHLLCSIFLLLAGCSTAPEKTSLSTKKIYLAGGEQAYSIECSYSYNWRDCYEKAGGLCDARGYDITDKFEFQDDYLRSTSHPNRRIMFVKCN